METNMAGTDPVRDVPGTNTAGRREGAMDTSGVHPPVPTMWESLGQFINNSTRGFVGDNLIAPPRADEGSTTSARGAGGLASAQRQGPARPWGGSGGDYDDENAPNRNFNWISR